MSVRLSHTNLQADRHLLLKTLKRPASPEGGQLPVAISCLPAIFRAGCAPCPLSENRRTLLHGYRRNLKRDCAQAPAGKLVDPEAPSREPRFKRAQPLMHWAAQA